MNQTCRLHPNVPYTRGPAPRRSNNGGNRATGKETPLGDVTTQVYDAENRLVSVETPGGSTVTFQYDGNHRRVGKDDGLEERKFIWAGADLLSETDDLGSTLFVNTLETPSGSGDHSRSGEDQRDPRAVDQFGRLLSRYDESLSSSSFHHFDGLGSTTHLTDDAEVETDAYIYRAFGELAGSSGSTENPHQWVGQWGYYRDEELDRYHLRRRGYDPSRGQFTSADPLGFQADGNFYRYVKNDAVNEKDPSGLQEQNAPRTAANSTFSEQVKDWVRVFDPEVYAFWTLDKRPDGTFVGGQASRNIHIRPAIWARWQSTAYEKNREGHRPQYIFQVEDTLRDNPVKAALLLIDEVREGEFSEEFHAMRSIWMPKAFGSKESLDPKKFQEWRTQIHEQGAEQAAFLSKMYIEGVVGITMAGEVVIVGFELTKGYKQDRDTGEYRWTEEWDKNTALTVGFFAAAIVSRGADKFLNFKFGGGLADIPGHALEGFGDLSLKAQQRVMSAVRGAKSAEEAQEIFIRSIDDQMGVARAAASPPAAPHSPPPSRPRHEPQRASGGRRPPPNELEDELVGVTAGAPTPKKPVTPKKKPQLAGVGPSGSSIEASGAPSPSPAGGGRGSTGSGGGAPRQNRVNSGDAGKSKTRKNDAPTASQPVLDPEYNAYRLGELAKGKSYDDVLSHADWKKNRGTWTGSSADGHPRPGGASDAPKTRALTPAERLGIPDTGPKDFRKWFDSQSVDDIARLYKNTEARDLIKSRLRHGGGDHEWLMVSRAAQVKAWGSNYDDIVRLVTPTKSTYFRDPVTGVVRRHGTNSISSRAHKQIGDLIDSSNSFEQFRRKLNNWAEYSGWLPNGRADLPPGLRL